MVSNFYTDVRKVIRFSKFESLFPATNVKNVSKRQSLRPQRSCCKAHSRFQPSRTCRSPTGVKAAFAGAGSLSIDTWHICMQGYFLFRVSSSTSGFSGSKALFVRVLYDNGLEAMQHLRISFSAKSSLLTRSPAMARRKADFTGLVLQGEERSWPRIIVEYNVAIAARMWRTARKHNTPLVANYLFLEAGEGADKGFLPPF